MNMAQEQLERDFFRQQHKRVSDGSSQKQQSQERDSIGLHHESRCTEVTATTSSCCVTSARSNLPLSSYRVANRLKRKLYTEQPDSLPWYTVKKADRSTGEQPDIAEEDNSTKRVAPSLTWDADRGSSDAQMELLSSVTRYCQELIELKKKDSVKKDLDLKNLKEVFDDHFMVAASNKQGMDLNAAQQSMPQFNYMESDNLKLLINMIKEKDIQINKMRDEKEAITKEKDELQREVLNMKKAIETYQRKLTHLFFTTVRPNMSIMKDIFQQPKQVKQPSAPAAEEV